MRAPGKAVAKEQEVEVRGAHLPKIAEGGAASVVIAQETKNQSAPAPKTASEVRRDRSLMDMAQNPSVLLRDRPAIS